MDFDFSKLKGVAERELTCDKVKEFIKDEEMAAKEYEELGLDKLAEDERSHAEFFKKVHSNLQCGP